MLHGAFVSVNKHITRAEVLNHVFQLFNHRVWCANDYDTGFLLVLVRLGLPHVSGESAGGAGSFYGNGLP